MNPETGLPVGSVAIVHDAPFFPDPFQLLSSGDWFHGSDSYSDEAMAAFVRTGVAEVVYRTPDPNEGLAEFLWEGTDGRVAGLNFANTAHVTRQRYLTLARDVRQYIEEEGK